MAPPVLELVMRPTSRRGRYDVTLDDARVYTGRQPLYDGARELLKRGYDPAALLTVRHAGKAQRCFVPRPINEHARWTVEETSWDGPRGQVALAGGAYRRRATVRISVARRAGGGCRQGSAPDPSRRA